MQKKGADGKGCDDDSNDDDLPLSPEPPPPPSSHHHHHHSGGGGLLSGQQHAQLTLGLQQAGGPPQPPLPSLAHLTQVGASQSMAKYPYQVREKFSIFIFFTTHISYRIFTISWYTIFSRDLNTSTIRLLKKKIFIKKNCLRLLLY